MKKVLIFCLMLLLSFLYLSCASNRQSTENDSNRPFEQAPILIENVKPIYPPEAVAANITGVVWIKVLVDTLGVVRETMIIPEQSKNIEVFSQSTIDAAMKTKWKPARSNGKPLAVWVTYRVDFDFK